MTMANITHSRFPVGAMARAGATYVPVVPYRLSQPIGGFGISSGHERHGTAAQIASTERYSTCALIHVMAAD